MRVELFVEDSAHRNLLIPLLERVARKGKVEIRHQVRSARGGHAGAIGSFKEHQVVLDKGLVGTPLPDLLVVAIDGNCVGLSESTRIVKRATRPAFTNIIVPACPDPHIERWYLADPQSFQSVVGVTPKIGPEKCTRDHYKQILASAVSEGGYPTVSDGVEFARDIVNAMELYRAGKAVRSLGSFVDKLRGALIRASQGHGID